MKTSTVRQLEKITEDYIRENFKFVKIQGEPSRLKLWELEEEMSVAATSVECDYYEQAEDHGCLAYTKGVDRYKALTGLKFEEPSRLTRIHPDIDDDTSLEERADLKAEKDENLEAWYALQGALKGLTANLRDAIDPKYYQELKKPLLGYKKVAIRDYFEHIKKEWCVLDTEETRLIKQHYFCGWNEEAEEEALAMFGKRLDDKQEELREDNIIITAANKLQHYMEQMYASQIFEQQNYDDWEDLDVKDKTWDNATNTFRNYVKKQQKYNQNKRGNTAKRAKYKSRLLRGGECIGCLTGNYATGICEFVNSIFDSVVGQVGPVGTEGICFNRINTCIKHKPKDEKARDDDRKRHPSTSSASQMFPRPHSRKDSCNTDCQSTKYFQGLHIKQEQA